MGLFHVSLRSRYSIHITIYTTHIIYIGLTLHSVHIMSIEKHYLFLPIILPPFSLLLLFSYVLTLTPLSLFIRISGGGDFFPPEQDYFQRPSQHSNSANNSSTIKSKDSPNIFSFGRLVLSLISLSSTSSKNYTLFFLFFFLYNYISLCVRHK